MISGGGEEALSEVHEEVSIYDEASFLCVDLVSFGNWKGRFGFDGNYRYTLSSFARA
jgi:hypothetical protein